ncbi:MAG: MFS transporter [Actinomycetota bacterium]|nr:MFS transporter [Actinomycetota bacterium]
MGEPAVVEPPKASERDPPSGPPARLAIASWVLFDFATTIFSYVVLSRYFNEWIVIERGQPDIVIGVMSVTVALALVVALPSLGVLADRLGRHKPLLVAFTLCSVTGTALLGVIDGVVAALVVAGVAIFCFNSAEGQYHPLLASVAPPRLRSLVSGIGVGVGYVGALVALILLGQLVGEGDNQRAFLPTAALYLLFALPCLLFVRDRRARAPVTEAADGASLTRVPADALAQLAASVRRAARMPHGRFLLARFLYVDAIATVIAFMTVYARRTGGFSSGELDALLALSTGFAIAGAVGAGWLAGRVGPKRVLTGTLGGVFGALMATGVSGSSDLLWVVGPLVGAGLGSVSASDRVLLLRLVPPERRGEDFGLYALVGKISSGFGPLVLWGGTIALLADVLALTTTLGASRVAVCVLAASALAGLVLLRRLPASAEWATPR